MKKVIISTACCSMFLPFANAEENAETVTLKMAKKSYRLSFKSQSIKLIKAYDKAISEWTKKGELDKAIALKKEKTDFLNLLAVPGVLKTPSDK